MSAYAKAIAAALTGVTALLAQIGLEATWATPELITAVATVIGTLLVYFVPNRS